MKMTRIEKRFVNRKKKAEGNIQKLKTAFKQIDIGKIKTRKISPEGHVKYIGHAAKGDRLIDTIASRLKFDSKTKDAVKFAAHNHMKIHDVLKMNNNTLIKLMKDPNWATLLAVGHMDAKARGKLFNKKEWMEIENKINQLAKKYADKGNDPLTNIRKVVTGDLVMKLKKIKPGKQVGEYIAQTVDWIVNNNINMRDIKKIEKFIKDLK